MNVGAIAACCRDVGFTGQLEVRAVTGLASWLADRERHTEGYGLLAPVYGRMTEGFATPDLKAAKLLVDTLA